MKEVLYGLNSLVIAGVLLCSMVLAIVLGHRVGRRTASAPDAPARDHVNAIQSSLLGVLALLLGFTFSLALQRFDSRSEALVDEANAIGTAYLRARLLQGDADAQARALLQRYVDLRVRSAAISLEHDAPRHEVLAQTNAVLDALWGLTERAVEADPNPVRTGLFVQSLNDMIDAYGRRDAALGRHVPEVIWLLLYATFVLTSAVVGYASGSAGHRPAFATYILVVLIVVLAFLVVDLDRPRRGLIRVDQASLLNLKAGIDADLAPGAAAAGASPLPRPAVTGRP
ncbi:MAG: DUF4239 domain-containing protein [Burkholderiaceae bacterium]|nr:MAG: DUF4239 domain-containing protein [Burkholderiaceae bacterium]